MKRLFFAGIGGAGMAPLARIALQKHFQVFGSDQVLQEKTAELARMGAEIFSGHRAENLPEGCGGLVYSSAVPEDNPERVRASVLGIPQWRRGEFLARIMEKYPLTAAVSGSHGKTSTTAMLVWILRKLGRDPGYLIGGAVPGMASGDAGDGTLFVTEADESDGTHTLLRPTVGIIPNIEDDHAWSVGGRDQLLANFRTFAGNCGQVLAPTGTLPEGFRYAGVSMTGHVPENLTGFEKIDALLAVAGAEALGVDPEEAAAALADFPGVCRRMTVHSASEKLIVMEDYAHHPTEVAAAISFLREKYPDRHLRVLIQPHRYARLARYFREFTVELRKADSVVVTPVFAAWSEKGEAGSRELAGAIGISAVSTEGSWEEIARIALQGMPEPAMLAVLGAGDIEQVFPFLPGCTK